MDDIEKQLVLYTKNIENGVDMAENYLERGLLYLDIEKHNLALEDINLAIENGFHWAAYYYRGIVYQKLKKYEFAIEDFSKVIKSKDDNHAAYAQRGNAYTNLNMYNLALKDFNKSIQLSSNDNIVKQYYYHSRGILYLRFKKYEKAITDFYRVIELNKYIRPILKGVYYNMMLLYDQINDYRNMKFYAHLYLYYSFEQQEIQLNDLLLNLWQDNIYNYKFLLDNFVIDFNSFLYVNYKNRIQLIQYIEDYYVFICLLNSDQRLQESQRAILNYYLGSPVATFIHYDEILDVEYYPLIAQELYYYSLMTDILGFEEDEKTLESAIKEISKMEYKSLKDIYYSGQLHLLNNDKSQAIDCFQNSQEFTPSFIMLMSFEEDTRIQKQLLEKLLKLDKDILIPYFTGYPKTAIKTKHSFETQFTHYFYTVELFTAVSKIKENYQLPAYLQGYTHLKIWEAFYLSDAEQAIINKALRNHKIQQLVDTITQDLEVKLVSIEDNDKTNYLEKIKNSLREDQDLVIREAFDSLLKTLKENGNLENHLGQMIEAFRLEKAQLYLYLISYFYLQGNFDSYQAFSLFSYLIETVSLKKSKAVKESLELLVPSDFSELFITTLGLSRHLYKLVHLHKAYNALFEDYNAYQLQQESHYMTFKKNIHTYISINKETLSEEMFNKKFQCFPAIIDYNLGSI